MLVGTQHGKDMAVLVKYRSEKIFNKPTRPTAQKTGVAATKQTRHMQKATKGNISDVEDDDHDNLSGVDKFEMAEYNIELKAYKEEVKKYKTEKEKVFALIQQQCTVPLINKLESLRDYQAIELANNICKFLDTIKNLAYSQYEYWAMVCTVRSLIGMQQGEMEAMTKWKVRSTWQ